MLAREAALGLISTTCLAAVFLACAGMPGARGERATSVGLGESLDLAEQHPPQLFRWPGSLGTQGGLDLMVTTTRFFLVLAAPAVAGLHRDREAITITERIIRFINITVTRSCCLHKQGFSRYQTCPLALCSNRVRVRGPLLAGSLLLLHHLLDRLALLRRHVLHCSSIRFRASSIRFRASSACGPDMPPIISIKPQADFV